MSKKSLAGQKAPKSYRY